MISYEIRNGHGTVIARIEFIDELARPSWLSFLGRAFFWDGGEGPEMGRFQELRDEPKAGP